MPYNRGDVVLVIFPDSNLVTAKRRPVLVVQADHLNTGLAQTIVAMITSNPSRAGHQSRVKISTSSADGKQTGLLSDSVVMTDNLATILLMFAWIMSRQVKLLPCFPAVRWTASVQSPCKGQ
jgi:mRNA interferase MazF